VSQNCVILNARTLSKRAAREAREAREARAHEKREKLEKLARERASERAREGGEYVRAGKEEDARRRATGYLSLPVSYSAGGPGGTNQYAGCPVSFVVYILFLGLKEIYFCYQGSLV
jgi:hypothetical protein